MLSVAEAQAVVLKDVSALAPETVALRDAHGRVLAADLAALRTQPPAAVSAMDGYAVRSADVARAPARLRLIGEVAAGHPFDSPVGPGEAARIFTGGVLPPGADTVVVQEITAREGDAVVVQKTSAPGRHIRPQGLDFKAGEALLRRGHRLTARDLALAAAMNHPVVPVHRRPKVAVLATGDELVLPGEPLGHGQIVYSNGFALMAQVAAEGAEVIDLGIAPDRLDAAVDVLGLPGNPVSAFVCGVLFLVPLLRRLAGRTDLGPDIESATLGRALPANDERTDYMRAALTAVPDGSVVATPFETQDS